MVKTGFASNYAVHFGGALSSVELLIFLYLKEMNYDLTCREWAERDRFFLSKGHGVLSYYTVLQMAGFFDEDKLSTFQQNEGELSSHPVRNLELGIESSNGSLGQGLSLAVGNQIIAVKKDRSYRNFVLLGDGECDEGSVWEAAMCASHYHLDHLMAIVDRNGLQSDGTNDSVMSLGDLEGKWKSFGWETWKLDGNDLAQIDAVFAGIDWNNGKPKAIIANTVKGKGISFMENNNDWHHRQMTEKEFQQAMEELRGR
ncbi:MAG: transketolase [Ruminococcaceae bacterium]|nr:transketolase [Oscillospiraceae bacterium]